MKSWLFGRGEGGKERDERRLRGGRDRWREEERIKCAVVGSFCKSNCISSGKELIWLTACFMSFSTLWVCKEIYICTLWDLLFCLQRNGKYKWFITSDFQLWLPRMENIILLGCFLKVNFVQLVYLCQDLTLWFANNFWQMLMFLVCMCWDVQFNSGSVQFYLHFY